jgi:hypothetical protein
VTAGHEPQDISYLCSRMFMLDGRSDIALAEAYTFADPLPDRSRSRVADATADRPAAQ